MNKIKLTLLGIMVVLTAGLRAQNTFFDSPGNTITLTSQTFPGNVFIESRTRVVIPAGVVIKMKEFTKIKVRSGGAMLEVNGKIELDNGAYWEGIEVEGNVNFPQINVSYILSGSYPAFNINANGVVFLNNATIEYAFVGVRSTNGGIIYGRKSNFNYCFRAVTITAFPKQVASTLDDCDIISDNSLSDIVVQNAYGFLINNCRITYDQSGLPSPNKPAVDIYEGGAFISKCTFKDYSVAIHIRSDNGSFRRPVSINKSIFEDCYTGIKVHGCDYVTIKDNNFYNTTTDQYAIGTEIIGSVGFNYSGNSFYNFSTSTNLTTGVSTFRNTGTLMGNMTHNNYYWNCLKPVLAFDNNRDLQIKCNDFAANFAAYYDYNIHVFGNNGGVLNPDLGIPDQGRLFANDNIGYHLAGNLFTNLGPSQISDIEANPAVPGFTYYHHQKIGSSDRVEPKYIRSKVTKAPSLIANSSTRNQACWLWLAENNPVSIRMGEHIAQRNQMISDGLSENHESVLYMNQIIEHDVAQYAIELVESEDEEALLAFLHSNPTNQKKMMLVQYYISSLAFDSAEFYLNAIVPDTSNSDLGYFIDYYSRLIDILQLNEGERILSASDSAYFLAISELKTPVAAKAMVLLGLIGNSEENNLISSIGKTNNLATTVSIFPQPASDIIYIKGAEGVYHSFAIYDITMRKVADGRLSDNKIDVNQLHNGIYYLYLTGNEQQASKKIIISE